MFANQCLIMTYQGEILLLLGLIELGIVYLYRPYHFADLQDYPMAMMTNEVH